MLSKIEIAERKAEMSRLRFDDGWTIEAIGEKFGVTRERVRQILGNSGHLSPKFRTKQIQSFDNLRLTNTELSEKYGISVERIKYLRRGLLYALGPGEGVAWKKSRDWLSALLTEWDVKYTILSDFRFKLVGSGQILWPVVGQLRKHPSSKSPHPRMLVRSIDRLRNSDFLLAMIEDTGTVYIIPTWEVRSTICLQEQYGGFSERGRKGSKHEKYREAWYLLDMM